MIKKKLVTFLILIPLVLFAQQKKLSPFFKALEEKSQTLELNGNLNKARKYFLEKNWDSTMVYSVHYLNQKSLGQKEDDYAHFFKAYSLRRKKIFESAIQEYDQISKNFDFYERVFFYRAVIEIELERYTDAIVNLNKALKSIDKESMVGVRLTTLNNNLGISYLHLNQFEKADEYLLSNIKIVEQRKDTLKLVGSYTNLANSYYARGLDDKAIPYFKKAYELSKHIDDLDWQRRVTLNLAAVEESLENYKNALIYRKEFQELKDSLNDQNRIYETAQLEKKIAIEQKEKEMQVLEAENKAQEAQNRVYLYSGISLAVLLVIVFYSYKAPQKRHQIITAQKDDLDALNSTKDKLFSIVSHDLRSSVNAIKTSNKKLLGTLDSQDKEEISQNLQQNSAIVNGAYGLLDNLLHWAMLQTQQSYFEMTQLALSRIVDHVAYNYQPILEDQKIKYSNLVSRKTQIFADQESLKIILRNLLDNAIKFSEEKGKINIYTYESSDEYVHLVIEDSGLGMDAETRKELLKDTQLLSKKKHEDILGTGLGLHLVKSMIAKNQGVFDIESEEGKGTKMIISLLRSQES